MALHLSPDLHYAGVGGRLILLDLASCRYLGLSQTSEKAFLKLLDGYPLSQSEELSLAPMINRKLLIAGGVEGARRKPLLKTPIAQLDNGSLPRAVFTAVLGALAQHQAVRLRLRLKSLRSELAWLVHEKRKVHSTTSLTETITASVSAFRSASLLLSTHDRCLTASIALAHNLLRKSVPADLVIGVRASPFHAHSWVEHSGVVLNDNLEHVSSFTPILAI